MTSKPLRSASACRFPTSAGALLTVLALALPAHAAAQKVTPTLVVGLWKLQDKQQESSFDFRADSTFTVELPTTLGAPYIATGRWHLAGDTVALSELMGSIATVGDNMPFNTDDPVVWFDNNRPRMTGHFGVYVPAASAKAATPAKP